MKCLLNASRLRRDKKRCRQVSLFQFLCFNPHNSGNIRDQPFTPPCNWANDWLILRSSISDLKSWTRSPSLNVNCVHCPTFSVKRVKQFNFFLYPVLSAFLLSAGFQVVHWLLHLYCFLLLLIFYISAYSICNLFWEFALIIVVISLYGGVVYYSGMCADPAERDGWISFSPRKHIYPK